MSQALSIPRHKYSKFALMAINYRKKFIMRHSVSIVIEKSAALTQLYESHSYKCFMIEQYNGFETFDVFYPVLTKSHVMMFNIHIRTVFQFLNRFGKTLYVNVNNNNNDNCFVFT